MVFIAASLNDPADVIELQSICQGKGAECEKCARLVPWDKWLFVLNQMALIRLAN
ncbi:hypothetical protein [Ruegeria arenilitoris]|uniref:hypothetical protein n=1 Tax=Ruegeria arenilitoris TaxID=1173585 RepID=UPI001479E83F|nr:hypothetical protein [Ruegeria arenilitoris]